MKFKDGEIQTQRFKVNLHINVNESFSYINISKAYNLKNIDTQARRNSLPARETAYLLNDYMCLPRKRGIQCKMPFPRGG